MGKLIRTKGYGMMMMVMIVVMVVVALSVNVGADVYTRKSESFNLSVPCIINGTYCSSSAVCNLTLISPYPDAEVVVDNEKMVNNYAYHVYEVEGDNLTDNGDYTATVVCTDQGLSGSTTFKVVVNPNGERPTIEKAVISFTVLGILFVVMGVLIFLVFYFRNVIAKMAAFWGMYLTAVATSFILWDISYGILYQEFIGNFFRIVFMVLIIGFLPLFYLTIAWMIKFLAYNRFFKIMINEGYDEDIAGRLAKEATRK